MKKVVIIPLIALLLTSLSCDTKQKGPSNLSVGKSKLIDSGNALEAVGLLEKAEQEEVNKLEPRALLVIAYSHGLATGDAASLGVEAKFKNQRSQRIQELTDAEIRQILQILSTPSRVRKAGLQALVDKGPRSLNNNSGEPREREISRTSRKFYRDARPDRRLMVLT